VNAPDAIELEEALLELEYQAALDALRGRHKVTYALLDVGLLEGEAANDVTD
jgi:hypothetical protein